MVLSRWIDKRIKYVFVLPALIFVLVMMVFPILYTLRLSFSQWSMGSLTPPRWIGLRNFTSLLVQDRRFWPAVGRTFAFTIIAVVIETVLGVAIALILNRDMRGKNVIKTLFLLPMVATPVAVGMVWLLMYEPSIGVINYFLKLLGLPQGLWLASPAQALGSLILVDVWQWTPMITLIVLAGLAALPSEPYEAALVDGASTLQSIRLITLPLLQPTILAAMTLRAIDAFKTYDIIYTMTQGGPGYATETLNIYSFVLGFQYFQMGKASALLIIFFALTLGLAVMINWLKKPLEL
ncbi:MAG TPA: sugar ABC transporter permease [Limnochordia bacterium]|jgi:multiple sugar transport system permease protein|nr:sugar ABC transporter permease [Limnochordia bacterium]